MALYRFYHLTVMGRVSMRTEFDCADDEEARVKAHELCANTAIEVWQHTRMVCRVEKAVLLPPPSDRPGGQPRR